MSIQEKLAAFEGSFDRGGSNPASAALTDLTELLNQTSGADTGRVRVLAARLLHDLGRHEEVLAQGQAIVVDPEADPRDLIWGRYWVAHSLGQLSGTKGDITTHLMLLQELGNDTSAGATDLGNRLWEPMVEEWPQIEFVSQYLAWAEPRISTASPVDQDLIRTRLLSQLDAVTDSARHRDWLERLLTWPNSADRDWSTALRQRLAVLQRAAADYSGARETFLSIALEWGAEPAVPSRQIEAEVLAARMAMDAGRVDQAASELQDLARGGPGESVDTRKARALAGQALVRALVSFNPAAAEQEADSVWLRFREDSSPRVRYLAGLALAATWNGNPKSAPADVIARATAVVESLVGDGEAEAQTLLVMALTARSRARQALTQLAAAAVDAHRAANLASNPEVAKVAREAALANQHDIRVRQATYAGRDDIHAVVKRLLSVADATSARGDHEASGRDYWRTFEMANPSPDPATRLLGLTALQRWTLDLLTDRRDLDAIRIARMSIENALTDSAKGKLLQAHAWLHLGAAAARSGDLATAREAHSQVRQVLGAHPSGAALDLACEAEWNLAQLVDDGTRGEEALAAYRQLIVGVGDTASPQQQRRVAKALKRCAELLLELGRPEDAESSWRLILRRFEGATDSELIRLVQEARNRLDPSPSQPRRGVRGSGGRWSGARR